MKRQDEMPYERFFTQYLPLLNQRLMTRFKDILTKCCNIRSLAFWIFKRDPSEKTAKQYIRMARMYHDIYGEDNLCPVKLCNLFSDIDSTEMWHRGTL